MGEGAALAMGDAVEWEGGSRLGVAEGIDTLLREYVANPAFRSAEGSELLFSDNPFHRPVRPNDLDFVDFSHPVPSDHCSELSALMGQRLLLNVYETDFPLVSERPLSPQAMRDRDLFYADENRLRGERVRPFIEKHVFTWVDSEAQVPDQSVGRILDISLAQGHASAAGVFEAIDGCGAEHGRMARFACIQLTGVALSRELAIGRWSCIDWDGQVNRFIDSCSALARATQADLMALSASCGLATGPHTYWQFYLAPWIGVTNYLHRCLRDPRRIDEAIGAVLFDRLRFASVASQWRDTLARACGFSPPPLLFAAYAESGIEHLRAQALDLLAARARVHGDEVLRAAARGIVGMQRVWYMADEDLVAQCSWAARVHHFRRVAERYMHLISTHALEVNMETYDEASSERSTTHVHDTNRLLVIDSGEMDFWNSFGLPIHFVPGDMIYVPRHRLHGSVVTSTRCVYHQPIIDDSLSRAYAERWHPSDRADQSDDLA